MTKQNGTKMLCHNKTRHKILIKILKRLKKSHVIFDFTPLPHLSDTMEYFKVIYPNKKILNIAFWRSILPKEVNLANNDSCRVDITIGDEVKLYKVRPLLQKIITKHGNGFNNEDSFEVLSDKFLDKLLFKVIKALNEDDINGIDFWIKYKGFNIPLQLKSSKSRQEEHKKKFPLIPSLVFRPTGNFWNKEKFTETVTNVCENYLKKIIVHI